MDVLDKLGQEAMEKKEVPEFRAGDTLRVYVRIVEKGLGKKDKARVRPQMFEGVCIRRNNSGVSSTFTVRKISYGVGVERIFPVYSPRLESIEVVRSGKVRRSKLYYLRERRGKAARLKEQRSDKR